MLRIFGHFIPVPAVMLGAAEVILFAGGQPLAMFKYACHKAGVDFATISQWLGHASLNTTMAYARADLDLKRQALMQVFRDAPRPPRAGRVGLERLEVAGWLRRL